MCGPAIGLIGAAVSAVGSIASASAGASASEGQARAAEYNAAVEKINARTQRQRGLVEQERLAGKYDKLEGQGIAAAARGGVDPGYGSAALAIFGDNAADKASDMAMAYVNAEGQAVGHENRAKQYEYEAKLRRNEASAQRTGGIIGGASSFLNGIGNVAKSGGFGSALQING